MNLPSSHRNTPSRRWKHTLAALTTLSTLTALTAGAAHASNQYGAIAFNKQTRAYGYSYNHASQAAAEADAVARCAGSQCRSMMWFANGCGALAVGSVNAGNRLVILGGPLTHICFRATISFKSNLSRSRHTTFSAGQFAIQSSINLAGSMRLLRPTEFTCSRTLMTRTVPSCLKKRARTTTVAAFWLVNSRRHQIANRLEQTSSAICARIPLSPQMLRSTPKIAQNQPSPPIDAPHKFPSQ